MKLFAFGLSASLVLAGACFGFVDEESRDEDKTRSSRNTIGVMRAKLANSQQALDGVLSENYVRIRSAALGMKKLGESHQWPKSSDEVYMHYEKRFRHDCDKLAEKAEQKDLEGAQQSYQRLTTTCIDCHNYVRGRFQVKRDAANPRGPVILIPSEWEEPVRRKKSAGLPKRVR